MWVLQLYGLMQPCKSNRQLVKPISKPVLQQEVDPSSSEKERCRRKERNIPKHKEQDSKEGDSSEADDDEWRSSSGSELGLTETSLSTDEDCSDSTFCFGPESG